MYTYEQKFGFLLFSFFAFIFPIFCGFLEAPMCGQCWLEQEAHPKLCKWKDRLVPTIWQVPSNVTSVCPSVYPSTHPPTHLCSYLSMNERLYHTTFALSTIKPLPTKGRR